MNSFVVINFEQAAEPFFLLAGPNVIESEEHVLHMAKHIKNVATKYAILLVMLICCGMNMFENFAAWLYV